jgi:hypothetical protein
LAEDDVFALNDGTECSTELLKAMTDNYYNPVPEGAEDPDIKDAIKGTALEAQYKMLVDRCTKEDSMKGTECVRRMMDSQVIKVLGKVVMIVWLCGCVCVLSRWSLTREHAFHIIVLVYLQRPSKPASLSIAEGSYTVRICFLFFRNHQAK